MTAQVSDQIRYKRRFYSLFSEPLEDYFNEQHPKPEAFSANDCSACWRGYIAYWAIKRGKLFLEYISPWDGPNPDPAIGETVDDAYAGDVVGLVGNYDLLIGDTLASTPGVTFDEIPRFAPECFSFLHNLSLIHI